jgi:phenylacetate-CoA ligase
MAIDFQIRDFCYPLGLYQLRRRFERTQWLPPEELRTYQEQRIAVIINQAYNHVPYYRQLFKKLGLKPADIRSLGDLKKLPVLLKDTVRKESPDFVADNAARYHPTIYKTSGTSGAPMAIYRDKHSKILEFVYYWRHWSWRGFSLGDRFAELGSYYFLRRDHLGEAVSSWQPQFRRLMLNSGQIGISHAKEMAEAIRKYRPRFLKGLASSLYFFALCFKETGITDLSFKAIFSVGDALTPKYRSTIESVFACPVLDSYGHMEGTVAISQCVQGGYHINSDYGLLELDDVKSSVNGTSVLGRAIGTSMYNLAMPLIRYDVGDDIELFAEPKSCPCGRTLPLVKGIHGRSEDTIVTPDGRFITSLFIVPELVEGIRFVQFIQENHAALRVNVVPNESWSDEEQNKLLFYVTKLVGKAMDVHISRVTAEDIITDKSGKIRPVISSVPT